MDTRTCSSCKTTLPLSEFFRHHRCRDGYRSQCKKCCAAYTREYNRKHLLDPARRESRREYLRKYFADPEIKQRRRAYLRKYYANPAIAEKERHRKSTPDYMEKNRERNREHRRTNKDNSVFKAQVRESQRRSLANPINREKARVRKNKWWTNPANQEKVRETRRLQENRRRARKAATENTFTKADWQALVARSKHCHWCKQPFTSKRPPTHDHVIPISRGGANSLANSCCAHHSCNARKGAQLFNPETGQGILL